MGRQRWRSVQVSVAAHSPRIVTPCARLQALPLAHPAVLQGETRCWDEAASHLTFGRNAHQALAFIRECHNRRRSSLTLCVLDHFGRLRKPPRVRQNSAWCGRGGGHVHAAVMPAGCAAQHLRPSPGAVTRASTGDTMMAAVSSRRACARASVTQLWLPSVALPEAASTRHAW